MPESPKKPTRTSMTPGAPPLRNVVTPVAVYALWTQEQAATFLNVSTRYLRDSSCPKHLLPGNGKKKKEPVLRYKPEAVMRWVDNWSTESYGLLIRETD
ncbi:MAG TPA: hypothetical protein VGD77_06465 [Gemmatimonadaceae bacterium]